MTIMAGVKRWELGQVQAGELSGLGYRQTKRVWRRYRDEGDAGLVHRLRGKARGCGASRLPCGRTCWRLPPRNATRILVRRCWARNSANKGVRS